MSICTFLASDSPLPAYAPSQTYPLEINIDDCTIFDGDVDDNYFPHAFPIVSNYTDKKYGVCLEWLYTEGRAKQIIEYIKAMLQETDSVELWHIWLMDYWEFEDRPVIHQKTMSFMELTPNCIRQIDDAEIWNTPDNIHPSRPSFYCLNIVKLCE